MVTCRRRDQATNFSLQHIKRTPINTFENRMTDKKRKRKETRRMFNSVLSTIIILKKKEILLTHFMWWGVGER